MRRVLLAVCLICTVLGSAACGSAQATPTPAPTPTATPIPTPTPSPTPSLEPGVTRAPPPVPDTGDWSAVSTDGPSAPGELSFTFTVSGTDLVNATVVWVDVDGFTHIWTASVVHVLDGNFDSSAFTSVVGKSSDTLELSGTFVAPDKLSGIYLLTDAGEKRNGMWEAAPKP